MTQIHDRFWRTLGRQQMLRGIGLRENTRHRQDLARQGILNFRDPAIVDVLGARQPMLTESLDRLFHRIIRIGWSGKHRKFG